MQASDTTWITCSDSTGIKYHGSDGVLAQGFGLRVERFKGWTLQELELQTLNPGLTHHG